MLWSLISSAYVIYLYRKLRSERSAQSVAASTGGDSLDAEVDKLDAQISALEARLAARSQKEATP